MGSIHTKNPEEWALSVLSFKNRTIAASRQRTAGAHALCNLQLQGHQNKTAYGGILKQKIGAKGKALMGMRCLS